MHVLIWAILKYANKSVLVEIYLS